MRSRLLATGLAALVVAIVAGASAACSSERQFIPPSVVNDGTPSPTVDPASSPSPTVDPSITSVPPPSPVASTSPSATVQPEPLRPMGLERAFSWFSPERPTHMLQAPDGTGRIFVSEQEGRLIVISGDPGATEGTEHTALDITGKVSTENTEEGFLGFTFHPDFAQNGRLFVYYSAAGPRRSVISEFHVSGDDVDPGSERIIMEVDQPAGNHNGGMLIFGPDGYMYISLGDGGGQGDPNGNAQDLEDVLGSVLRIDVDAPGSEYGIPPDNPFASGQAPGGGEAAPEIWAYGLRNPWRLAFDPVTGELWTADAGQYEIEEVDLIVRGGNYGWNYKEGPQCYEPPTGCEEEAPEGLIDPVISYPRVGENCTIIGGYVYRSSRLPSLNGAYIYADFCAGNIWALRYADGAVQENIELDDSDYQIPAFGQTLDGEVYVLTFSDGIYRFVEE